MVGFGHILVSLVTFWFTHFGAFGHIWFAHLVGFGHILVVFWSHFGLHILVAFGHIWSLCVHIVGFYQ